MLGGASEQGGFTARGFVGSGADARYRYSVRHTFSASVAVLGAYALAERGS